jgi:branched-chain amino acid transport system substrate-binding protein
MLVMLVIGGGLGYALHPTPPPLTSTLPAVIPIGALLSLTGDFSSYGVRAQATVKIAESEINAYVTSLGIPTTFKFYVEDFQTKPDVALTGIQALYAQGCKVVIGGMTSGAMKAIDSYADTNKIIVIDGTSTAARESVAPPGDYEIRVVPAAEAEGAALVAAMKSKGFSNVVMISAEDTYSLSIHDAFKTAWSAAGGNLVADVTYAYPTTTDFTVVLNTVEQQVAPLLAAKTPVAIFANMWEDVATMLTQANTRNSPLLGLTWFGPDTLSQDTVIIQNAGAIATKVNLISVQLMAPLTSKHLALNQEVQAAIGQEPDIYALATYDAAWIAALSILNAGKYDSDTIKAAVPTVAASYWGATGNSELNAAGDRVTMDMEFWAVVQSNWQRVATYSSVNQQVTWIMQL